MARDRRKHNNSIDQDIQNHVDVAEGPPEPPLKIRQIDRPYYDAIVKSRAYMDWSDLDLIIVCQLAAVGADLASLQRKLNREDPVFTNTRGNKSVSPTVRALESMSARQLSLMRALRLAGRSDGDKPETDRARAQRQREIEDMRKQLQDEAAEEAETATGADGFDDDPLLAT